MVDRLFIILAFVLLFLSCIPNAEDTVLASVGTKELLLSDVIYEMPDQIEDSTYFIKQFINDWIKRELMVLYAEMNLSADLVQYEEQIEEYRSSLLIYAYQKQLLGQNFDTLVDYSEIKDYYDLYKDEFVLRDNIFKGRFIVVEKSAPNISFLDRSYKALDENTIDKLEEYCKQFSKDYYIEDDSWQFFSFFNNKLPNLIDAGYFLKNTKGAFFEDDIFRYYIFVKDYQLKGVSSPLEIEESKIRDVLLNKRKVQYLKQIEDELYQNALVNKKIKIY